MSLLGNFVRQLKDKVISDAIMNPDDHGFPVNALVDKKHTQTKANKPSKLPVVTKQSSTTYSNAKSPFNLFETDYMFPQLDVAIKVPHKINRIP